LCATPEETDRVLAAARGAARPLWEAFVFPFHEQMDRVRDALDAGEIGDVRELWSRFHFVLDDPRDIRLFAELAGGSIQDVGCYPIRLARLLFGDDADTDRSIAGATWTVDGVDTELWGALTFPGDRRLLLSSGFLTPHDTFTRVFGTRGELRITNPFHPDRHDTWSIVRGDEVREAPAVPSGERSFTPAIRHIHRALRGLEPPRHLAVDEAMGNAVAIASLLGSVWASRPA
jgi:predicted dehydrogenase